MIDHSRALSMLISGDKISRVSSIIFLGAIPPNSLSRTAVDEEVEEEEHEAPSSSMSIRPE